MIPKDCKRLAEVDFPIAVVSKHAAREKSIRHGHPSTLHLWWARRPLAACRAMLLALLMPDPCDEHCPDEFKKQARQLLPQVVGRIKLKDEDLRHALLKFIGDFANWDLSADRTYLEVSRGLVKAAHGEEVPLVVDPFAGGGSIPLEALRLGCETFASDLNPVACLILKVLLEDIPRHGPELAEELRRVGAQLKAAAEKELAEFYPSDADGARPIAYLWARIVRCESSGCGAEIPLVRSFWLSKKANRKRALRYKVVRPRGDVPRIEFEIFEPKKDSEVPSGTVSRAKAACPCCSVVLSPERVRAQLSEQRGGADVKFDGNGKRVGGARLLAVVTLKAGEQGRLYRLPKDRDYAPVWKTRPALGKATATRLPNGSSPVPDETLPLTELRRISLPIYGVREFRDIFNSRQLLSLALLSTYIRQLPENESAVNRLLALALGKTVDLNNANTRWKPDAECPVQTLARHDIPAAWDYAEAAPLGEASGSFFSAYDRTAAAIAGAYTGGECSATTNSEDACSPSLPSDSASVWFTDPPYYDSVPYAHLSDFFYVWEKRALRNAETLNWPHLTPKDTECVVDRPHSAIPEAKTRQVFEKRIGVAMAEGARINHTDGIACVVFAHKTTEGWEALLSGMIQGGWVITGSWPIVTEMRTRLNARENASLAASVHLVCRPRPNDASIGDWGEVHRELPNRVGEWIERLQSEGVRGADLVFACIGPAMEIYSRYSKVEDAEGREIPLGGDPTASEPYKRGFLAYVWETVGRLALQQVLGTAEAKARNGAAGALEEDARLTALFLWTLQSTNGDVDAKAELDEEDAEDEGEEEEKGGKKRAKGYALIFDVVRRFAQPLGIHLDQWEGRIIETEKGIVRLLPVAERAEQLFGEDGASAVATRLEQQARRNPQMTLEFALPEPESPAIKGRGRKGKGKSLREVSDEALTARREATTLDRVHAAMLLQSSGRANALRALIKTEQERGSDFLRLANALSALYPKDSEEKRLLDAMLLAVPR